MTVRPASTVSGGPLRYAVWMTHMPVSEPATMAPKHPVHGAHRVRQVRGAGECGTHVVDEDVRAHRDRTGQDGEGHEQEGEEEHPGGCGLGRGAPGGRQPHEQADGGDRQDDPGDDSTGEVLRSPLAQPQEDDRDERERAQGLDECDGSQPQREDVEHCLQDEEPHPREPEWAAGKGPERRGAGSDGSVLRVRAEGQAAGGRQRDDDRDGVQGEVRVDREVVHGDDCAGWAVIRASPARVIRDATQG